MPVKAGAGQATDRSDGHMDSIPEPPKSTDDPRPAPAVALEWSQRLRELVEAQYRAGAARYSPQRDAEYRRLLDAFLDLLRRTPSLKKLADYTHGLPAGLSYLCNEESRFRWDFVDRQSVVNLQGRILTVLERTGAAAGAHSGAGVTPSPQSNRAQRRAEHRRVNARELRAQGKTVKEIAQVLGCSPRTVYADLVDSPP